MNGVLKCFAANMRLQSLGDARGLPTAGNTDGGSDQTHHQNARGDPTQQGSAITSDVGGKNSIDPMWKWRTNKNIVDGKFGCGWWNECEAGTKRDGDQREQHGPAVWSQFAKKRFEELSKCSAALQAALGSMP